MNIIIDFQNKKINREITLDIDINIFIKQMLSKTDIVDYSEYELFSIEKNRAVTGTFSENNIKQNCEFILQIRNKKKIEKEYSELTDIDIDIELIDNNENERGQLFQTENIDNSKYKEYLLDEIYDSTIVKKCYIHNNTFNEIKEFCIESIKKKIKKEYGAFLLGKFFKKSDNEYIIYIEKFVIPTCYAFHNEYRIDFGSKAMIELDAALQKNKNMCLIGWFHTHPGHSVFLSNYDLNAHYGSFNEPYQTAIVTDTLTEEFDTGIFTRKINMEMNNIEDVIVK